MEPLKLHHNARRQRSLLETLCVYNSKGLFPSAVELIRADDPRITLTLSQVVNRRKLVASLILRGLIVNRNHRNNRSYALSITDAGLDVTLPVRYNT